MGKKFVEQKTRGRRAPQPSNGKGDGGRLKAKGVSTVNFKRRQRLRSKLACRTRTRAIPPSEATTGSRDDGRNPSEDPVGKDHESPALDCPQTPPIHELTACLKELEAVAVQMLQDNTAHISDLHKLLEGVIHQYQENGPEEPDVPQEEVPPRASNRAAASNRLDIHLKADVRQHSLLMLGRSDKMSPVPDPPSPRKVTRFVERGKGGPSTRLGRLRLDLNGPVRSPWNRRAARCFRKNFQKSGLYRPWPKPLVEEAFLRHTLTIRSHYCKQMGLVADTDITERRVRCARRNRLKTLVHARKQTCEIEPELARFRDYIDQLADGGGMSGDETDHCGTTPSRGQRKFFVIHPEWRSRKVTSWLRTIDKVYVHHRFSQDGRASRGNWVRQRVDSDRSDNGCRPVLGLPKNFYDATWLRTLSGKAIAELRIQPEISLEHSPTIKSMVSRYLPGGGETFSAS